MVIDLLLAPILSAVEWVVGLLPAASLTVPAIDQAVAKLAEVNSLVPIAPGLQAAVGLLSLLGVFLLVRAILVVWNLIWP